MFRWILLTASVLCVAALSSCSTSAGRIDQNLIPQGSSVKPFLVEKPQAPGERGTSSAPADPSEDYVFSWDLIAGQHTLAGTVDVALSVDELCVTYNMNAGFNISEAHLYVGLNPPDPKGAPGQFPYKANFNPTVNTWTYCVDLDSLGDIDECCQKVYLATHAVSNGETIWGGRWNNGSPSYETKWSKKWGGYFSTTLLPNPSLPTTPVWYIGYHPGANCYWGIDFENAGSHLFPSGSWTVSPAGNRWCGWCVDKNHSMFSGLSYKVNLYSSLDSSIPAFGQNANWDKINYLLTRRNQGTGIYNQVWTNFSNISAFQEAIWWFSDGIATGTPLANQFIADADANGDNFVPKCGDHYGVVLFPDVTTENNQVRAQMNIVEVECGN